MADNSHSGRFYTDLVLGGMKRVLSVAPLISAVLVLAVPQSSTAYTRGAVVLSKSNLRKVASTQCGRLKGKWISGTISNDRRFLSHVQHARNYTVEAKSAHGSRRALLLRSAKTWNTRATVSQKRCNTLNSSGSPNSTTAVVGGNCEIAGALAPSLTLQCRRFAGSSMKWVTVSAHPVAPDRTAGGEDISNCQLSEATGVMTPSMVVGFPRPTGTLPSTGHMTIGFVPLDFPDLVGTYDPLAAALSDLEYFRSWITEVSGGRVTVDFRTSSTWSRVSDASTSYDLARSGFGTALAQDGVDAADATFNFSGLSAVFFYLPRTVQGVAEGFNQNDAANNQRLATDEGPIRFWFGAGAYFYRAGYSVMSYWAHEILHSFGLVDLYVRGWYTSGAQPFDGYDIMADQDNSLTLASWSRLLLGWVSDDQIFCIRPSALTAKEVILVPIDRAIDGHKSVMVPLSATRVLVVESRRHELYTAQLPQGSDGPIVYVVDTSVGNGLGTQTLVVPSGHTDHIVAGRPPVQDAIMRVGESVLVGNVRVTLVDSGDHDTVRIERV